MANKLKKFKFINGRLVLSKEIKNFIRKNNNSLKSSHKNHVRLALPENLIKIAEGIVKFKF